MEMSMLFGKEFFMTMASTGLMVLGMVAAYSWRLWALNESSENKPENTTVNRQAQWFVMQFLATRDCIFFL